MDQVKETFCPITMGTWVTGEESLPLTWMLPCGEWYVSIMSSSVRKVDIDGKYWARGHGLCLGGPYSGKEFWVFPTGVTLTACL